MKKAKPPNRQTRTAAATQDVAAGIVKQAVMLHQAGRLDEAEAMYRHALKTHANNFDSLHLLGVIAYQRGKHAASLSQIDAALKIQPNIADAHNNRGNALKELKRLDEALASYGRAIALDPGYAEAFYNRGVALQSLHRLEEALADYDKAVALNANYSKAFNNRGITLKELKRYDEAMASFDRALAIRPGYADAFSNRGNALKELRRLDEALADYDRAIALDPANAEAFNNRGIALQDMNRLDDALTSFDQAIALKPLYAEAFHNRGNTLKALKRLDDALTSYDQAIAFKPCHAEAFYSRGMLALLDGRYREGWVDYEWRWKAKDFSAKQPKIDAKPWQGETLAGRDIAIYAEQGIGDVIQFARYLPILVQSGARVAFQAPPLLVRLLRTLGAGIDFAGAIDGDKTFEYQCALMSLPYRFGTELSSIPNQIPYLSAEGDLVTKWKIRIGEHGFRIGIAWQGNPEGKIDQGRSVPLAHFVPLLSLPGVRLISLQKTHGLDQIGGLPRGTQVETLGDEFDAGPDALIDTAAAMANLDLIITSDTSIAHLAGAMGRPIWVALKFIPDWRWLLDRDSSPWYPTMRLFRQETDGDWDGVFSQIARELRPLLAKSDTQTPAIQSEDIVPHANSPVSTSPGDRRPLFQNANLRVKACKHGMMMFHANDIYVGRSLDLYGEFSQGEMELLDGILQPAMTVVDVGANVGVHTLYFAKAVGPDGHVLAFEPQRALYHILCGNAALNGHANVHAVHAALGAESGSILVPRLDYTRVGNFGGVTLGHHEKGDEVPVQTLDSYPFKSCDLIKIDVEGMEQSVLQGARTLLAQHQPLLYVENDRVEKSPQLIQWLMANGYRLYWHIPRMFNPDNYFGETLNVFGKTISVNMLCVPKSKNFTPQHLREILSPEDVWQSVFTGSQFATP